MDEARYVDWQPIVDDVVNGRVNNHRCPECREGMLEGSSDGVTVRVRCPRCGVGFEGRLGYGRDDGMYAEADRIMKAWEDRRKAKAGALAGASSPAPGAQVSEVQAGTAEPSTAEASTAQQVSPAERPPATRPAPAPQREERWEWELPFGQGGRDEDALSAWMPIVEQVHNGRRTNLACPFCSEPLTDITARSPYLRVRCTVCGETFEGRVE